MAKFLHKIKDWWIRHKPSKRRLIQLYAFLLYNANIKGFISGKIYTSATTKYVCVPGLNCYSCPGAVGACPLGALQNALASSGTRAPYYMIGILVLFGIILGRTICGFLCPVGLGQELLYKIKTPKLKKSKYTRIFSYLKYVILAVLVIAVPIMYAANLPVPAFCKYICPAGTMGALALLLNPSNAGMFNQIGPLFTWKFSVLMFVCVASVFIFRFFCRFICPLGAFYGFFNKLAFIGVKLDKDKCTDCGLCVAHCKMDIRHVGDHECINCGECISVCPVKAISWKGSKLFVHKNAVEAVQLEPEETVRPLAAILQSGSAAQSAAMENAAQEARSVPLPQMEEAVQTSAEASEEIAASAPKTGKGRAFWLEFAAWVAALCVLCGALVYYNFIDLEEDEQEYGNAVGNLCPDFTLSLYGEDGGTFSLSETEGMVTVINFWATWCTPCVGELPYFIQLGEEYGDRVKIVAVHGELVTEDVWSFIQNKEWNFSSVAFAQDEKIDGTTVYSMLGGKALWPMTVVLNQEGVIVFNEMRSIKNYEDLLSIVSQLLNE